MSLNYKVIGMNLKDARVRHHMSQAELAERAEMCISHISRIENGIKRVSLDALVRISAELRVTIYALLNENQHQGVDEHLIEMNILMSDCSSYENRIIVDVASATKISLRKNAGPVEHKRLQKY